MGSDQDDNHRDEKNDAEHVAQGSVFLPEYSKGRSPFYLFFGEDKYITRDERPFLWAQY